MFRHCSASADRRYNSCNRYLLDWSHLWSNRALARAGNGFPYGNCLAFAGNDRRRRARVSDGLEYSDGK